MDDAAGEAFDKTAALLGLGYPGGPALAKLAATGNPAAHALPRPMLHSGDLDFSFSGLKTAVMLLTKKLRCTDGGLSDAVRADVAAAFEAAIVDVLTAKCLAALKQTSMQRLVVAGGVGANLRLRGQLTRSVSATGGQVFYPPMDLCTDNGAMIAFAGAMHLAHDGQANQFQHGAFCVKPRWPLTEIGSA